YVPTVPDQLRKDGQPLVIRAERGRTIEGVLLDQAGRPVLGVELYATIAEPEDRHVRCEAERLTDKDGRFRFSNLPDAVMRIGAVGVQLTEDRQFRPGVADATLHV